MQSLVDRLRRPLLHMKLKGDLDPLRPRSIRFRILTLVTLIVLPLVALFIWSALTTARFKREIIEFQRSDVTNRVSFAIDREMASVVGMLSGLVGGGNLQRNDIVEFERQAAFLAKQPNISAIWAFNKSGASIAGTPATVSQQQLGLSPDIVSDVFSGVPAFSGVFGSGPEQAFVIVAVPAPSGDGIAFGVAAKVLIARLSTLFAREGLTSDWVAAVVDRNGRYIARSLDTVNRLGDVARPELGLAARSAPTDGHFRNVTYEGVSMMNAYRRSILTSWTTVVAVPYDNLISPIRRAIALLFLVGMGTLAGTLVVSTLLAARISVPIKDLSNYTASLATGKPYQPAPHRLIELDEVRAALDNAMSQSARLSALVASSGDAIMSVDLDGVIGSWNSGAETLFGYTEQEIIGRPKTTIVPESRLAEYAKIRDKVVHGENVRIETKRLRKDGTTVDVSLELAPIRRPTGEVYAISSIIHDITNLKAMESHKTFLMRELAHRSKNQLAVIKAIAKQTARRTNSTEEFLTTFGDRLQGLAASHDLLAAQNWTTVPLAQLIEKQLEVFVAWPNPRLICEGPFVELSPTRAEALGLALHELATNAVKYGALAVPAGRVTIGWSLQSSVGEPDVLRIDWKEEGGPRVEPPSRKGFGSFVVERMVAQVVNGEAHIEYRPEGLHWSLQFPLG